MASRLNSDKVICGVLEDDCRLPEKESSVKESDSILVFARKRLQTLQRWKTLSNFLTCPLFGSHEREAFSGSLEVHMQPLQKTRRSVEHWTRALTALG